MGCIGGNKNCLGLDEKAKASTNNAYRWIILIVFIIAMILGIYALFGT